MPRLTKNIRTSYLLNHPRPRNQLWNWHWPWRLNRRLKTAMGKEIHDDRHLKNLISGSNNGKVVRKPWQKVVHWFDQSPPRLDPNRPPLCYRLWEISFLLHGCHQASGKVSRREKRRSQVFRQLATKSGEIWLWLGSFKVQTWKMLTVITLIPIIYQGVFIDKVHCASFSFHRILEPLHMEFARTHFLHHYQHIVQYMPCRLQRW